MSALVKFIEEENRWRSMFEQDPYTVPTNGAECEEFFQELECRLSPENLHCDGEISRAEANRKYNRLMKVWKAVEKIYGTDREVLV